jgi:kinesin family member 5
LHDPLYCLIEKQAAPGGDVRVVVRVRPLNASEISRGGPRCVATTSPEVIDLTGNRAETFTFDHVFDDDSTQADVFEYVAKPIVQEVLQGYNGTVFA